MLTVTSSEEKKSVYENIPKNLQMKNKERMCSFCRTKHILGYMNCPMYGSRCSYCKGMNHSARACWIRYPEFYRFSKSKAQSRSTRNSMDLRKHYSSSNVSLVDNEWINAEVGSEHKETKSIVKSTSDDFSVEALDTSADIVSAEIKDESKEHKATAEEEEIQLVTS